MILMNTLIKRLQVKQWCTRFLSSVTVAEATKALETKFEKGRVPEPLPSARHLVAAAIGQKYIPDKLKYIKLDETQMKLLDTWSECRLARMPVQYIIGEWDFGDLTLKMRPPVFIPRPETEQLAQLVLQSLTSDQKVLEIGCGSGAISLSLLHSFPDLGSILAIDKSGSACTLTLENAVLNSLEDRIRVLQGKVTDDGVLECESDPSVNTLQFDIVVSNPPYVLRKDLIGLEPEISVYEDLRALDGGKDGLDVIRGILKLCQRQLVSGGLLFLEVDPCHPLLIGEELGDLQLESVHKDFAGKDRFLVIKKVK